MAVGVLTAAPEFTKQIYDAATEKNDALPPRTLKHMTSLAPVLSATSSRVCIWIMGHTASFGPAPAGGVQILLSSGNPAAVTLPSSVTIPAGATSATFTVNTSIVLVSTSVHITATYNGTTKTATLDVLL